MWARVKVVDQAEFMKISSTDGRVTCVE
jgi:hypothetical protein